jgi:hypothetical protein
MPFTVILMQPIDITCLGLELMVPITNEEHPTTEEA